MTIPSPTYRKALVYCVDENLLPFALFSAEQAALGAPQRDFDILICSLTPLSIPAHFTALGILGEVIDLAARLERESLPQNALPLICYLRLWLPELLGDRYDRLLYLDADTYPQTDRLSDLFAVDMGHGAIAGVRDVQQWRKLFLPIHDFHHHRIKGYKYLNSGVLLFDCPQYQSRDCLARLLKQNATGMKTTQHDQSLINLALKDELAELHPTWNWQWSRRFAFFTQMSHPRILHFCGPHKPWQPSAPNENYRRDLALEYQRFFRAHFPDRDHPAPLPQGEYIRSPAQARSLLFHHLRHIGAYKRLTERFPSEFHVLDKATE